jgi:hypothetical protein
LSQNAEKEILTLKEIQISGRKSPQKNLTMKEIIHSCLARNVLK